MKNMRTSLVILLVLGLEAGAAKAQQPVRLTLQGALDFAEKQNLDLAAAHRRRAVAQAGIQVAGQRPNPTFNFTALRDAPHEGFFVNQPIETAGKRRRRIEVAQQESGLTEIDIAALVRLVRQRTRQAYYELAFARAETARLGELVRLTARLKQIAQDRFEAGAAPQLEVIQADLQLAQAQGAFQVAREREKVSLSQLNALLNEPAATMWELSGTLQDPLPDASLQDLVERAYTSNYELQRLAQEEKVEESRLHLARAQRVPDLSLEFGTDFNAPQDFRVGPRSQISLIVPLFYRNQGEIAQSLASQQVLASQIAATRRAVAGEVETAYFDWSAQKSQVEIYRDTLLPAARRLEEMAAESYQAGKTNILAVIDAQRNVQEVERTYQQSLLGFQTAFANLEEAVGSSLD
jgi:cobalt-zinc-cadmium efflux system outer membrane protein